MSTPSHFTLPGTQSIVPHKLPRDTAAWIKPHREPNEPWVNGQVIGCWAVLHSDMDFAVFALVKYGEGMLFQARLETTDAADVIRLENPASKAPK